MSKRALITRDRKRSFSMSDKRRIMKEHAHKDGKVFCACGCGTHIANWDGETWVALERIDFNHVLAHGFGGETIPGNGEPVRHKPCHLAITRQQVESMATAERQARRTGQQQRRMAGKTQKIQSRGFEKR